MERDQLHLLLQSAARTSRRRYTGTWARKLHTVLPSDAYFNRRALVQLENMALKSEVVSRRTAPTKRTYVTTTSTLL
uniref:Uncharacterized protein n=1 Tax=Arundo donax TaxID=35708 RepID=A0A0A9HRQ6_ARUDO